jgi:hypothetical protein
MIKQTADFIQHHVEAIKVAADGTAVSVAGAAWLGWVPDVTAFFALVYMLIRIYETDTVQGWIGKKHGQRSSEEESD